MQECVLILHDIRSVHNVGSIFRTADGAGVSNIILSGYTPTPLDRFKRERKDFAKVSLGAEKTMPWKYVENLSATLEELQKDGYKIIAVEQSERSKPLASYKPCTKFVLIVGNEVDGVSKDVLNQADVILEIPMRGEKESLNVSVATGIALFGLLN